MDRYLVLVQVKVGQSISRSVGHLVRQSVSWLVQSPDWVIRREKKNDAQPSSLAKYFSSSSAHSSL